MPINNPLISVLIRTKDRWDLLKKAVESVYNQVYRPIELVVINDGKDDIKPKILELLENNDLSFKYKHLVPSKGRSAAANAALEMSGGQFLMFLDDDDWISPEHLNILFKTLSNDENAVGAYSDVACVEVINNELKEIYRYSNDFDIIKLSYENFLPIHSVLFKRFVVDNNCRFNEKLEIYEDWHFWLQVVHHGKLIHVPQVTAFYRMDESGVGLPGTNKDFNKDYVSFLKEAVVLFNDEQLMFFIQSVKNLEKTQKLLTETNRKYDELYLLYEQQIKHLEKYEKLLNETNKKYDELYLLYEQQIKHLKKYEKLLNEKTKQYDELLILSSQQTQHLNNYEKVLMQRDKEYEELLSLYKQMELNSRNLNHQLELTQQRLSGIESSRTYKYLCKIRKIRNYVMTILYYLKPNTIIHKFKVLIKLIKEKNFRSILLRIKNKIKIFNEEQSKIGQESTSDLKNGFGILATKHTLFVGKLIEHNLRQLGFENIFLLTEEPDDYLDVIYIVICPQMFKKLPGIYISFQMEQSVSSRWFTKDYFRILENSFAIMDYSMVNIKYLQEHNLAYKQMFWTPISNYNELYEKNKNLQKEKKYDVVFYGDINNERRKRILKAISEKFSVLVLSEVFGNELYLKLNQAKVVVNIHYYEGALLETTRIFECLSMGLQIVSEKSADFEEHIYLEDYVYFCEIGDVDELLISIQKAIEYPKKRPLPPDIANFKYYFRRMLFAMELIPYESLSECESNITDYNANIISLSLPETIERYDYFKNKHPDIPVFHGLRHKLGWIGCAVSYKFLCEKATVNELDNITICEDDIIFPDNFKFLFNKIKKTLYLELEGKWDIFSGLIADISDETNILEVLDIDGVRYIIIDRMTSTVFNIYHKKAMSLIAKWNPYNTDVDTNTIDRYLEKNSSLKIVTTLPYLVGHSPELTSTLWHFQNDTYDEMIEKSQKKLERKVKEFLSHKK